MVKFTPDADYALSLHPDEVATLEEGLEHFEKKCWQWTGWKKRYWPADVIQRGLKKVYKFDLNKRELCVLLQVTHGGAFTFGSMKEFEQKVFALTERRPDPTYDNDSHHKWHDIQKRLTEVACCTGICLCWKVVRRESIHLDGKFPRLGWCDLRKPKNGMLP